MSAMIPVAEIDAYVRKVLLRDTRAVPPFLDRVRLTRRERDVLGMLLATPGTVRNGAWIAAGFGAGRRGGTRSNVAVYVSRLNDRLAPLGVRIANAWGVGYYLDRSSRRLLREACDRNRGRP